MTALLIQDGDAIPITRYVKVDNFFNSMRKSAFYFKNGKTTRGKLYAMKALATAIKPAGARRLIPLIRDVAEGNWKALGQFLLNMVFIGAMHFMDAYNFDLERVQMCCIHQILPDGTRVPFCTYQTIHRPFMERKFSIPLEEWKRSSRQLEDHKVQLPHMV